MDLINRAKKLPLTPGVYLFLGKKGEILYVGRATSLRRRVLSYFQEPLQKFDPRKKEMMDLAIKIKYFKTKTVLEAIILEANLIKKYWPKYNIREKDDRSFIYIIIPKTDYPKPIFARQHELKNFPYKSRVFGPYQSITLVKGFLRIIRRIFPYSTCRPFSGRPCFEHQIGLCPGLCVGKVSKEDYKKNIDNIILLLKGEHKKLFKKLKKENPEQIRALEQIQDVTLIKDSDYGLSMSASLTPNRVEGYDISHLTGKETYGSMVVFRDGEADKSQYRLFKIKEAPQNDDLRALEEIVERRLKHLEWPYPDLILIDGGKPQIDFISKVMARHHLNIPLIGISKLANDKLVYPKEIKKSFKDLAETIKQTLLKIRDEAHRFALKNSRQKRNTQLFTEK